MRQVYDTMEDAPADQIPARKGAAWPSPCVVKTF